MRRLLYALLCRLFAPFSRSFYVGTSSSLPPPLTPEEEASTLLALINKDPAAKTTLIEHNLRLVVYIARKFDNTGVDTDDLVSIGTIGLIKAVDTFRPEKNFKLATYASRCIENEILMYIRKIAPRRAEVSIEEPLHTDPGGGELHLSDILGTDEDEIYKNLESDEDRRTVIRAVKTLPERDRTVIALRYGLGGRIPLTQKQVADLLGISQSYISRIEKKNMLKLRKEIEEKV